MASAPRRSPANFKAGRRAGASRGATPNQAHQALSFKRTCAEGRFPLRPEESEMNDLKFGMRNKRGDWVPNKPVETAPLFDFPPRLMAVLKWLPHYFFPWNAIFAASAVAYWAMVIPP